METPRAIGLRRTAEMAAMFMIGDGVLGLLRADPHMALWESKLAPIDALTRPFQGRPNRRRLYGLMQVACGVALAARITR